MSAGGRLSFHDRTKAFHRSMPRSWPSSVKHVASVLFSYAGMDDGGGISCKLQTVVDQSGETERTVQRAQAFLRDGGFMVDEGERRLRPGHVIPLRRLVLERIAEVRGKEDGLTVSGLMKGLQVSSFDDETGDTGDIGWGDTAVGLSGDTDDTLTESKNQPSTRTDSGGKPPATNDRSLFPSESSTQKPESKNPQRAVAVAGMDVWNVICGGRLTKVLKLTDKRRQRFNKAFAEDFGGDLEQWRAYCVRVNASPFLTNSHGENRSGWKADFDFVLEPRNLVRILEGVWDPPEARQPGNAARPPQPVLKVDMRYFNRRPGEVSALPEPTGSAELDAWNRAHAGFRTSPPSGSVPL